MCPSIHLLTGTSGSPSPRYECETRFSSTTVVGPSEVLEHSHVSSAALTAPSLQGEKEERDDLAIWCNKLVDIQKQYKIISNAQEKDSVVDLAETIIDP